MASCKKCRRQNEKLFLKGEKCTLPKCPMVKKNYPPGEHGNKAPKRLSEYGFQLSVKQKIRHTYGIREKQLRNYFSKVKNIKGDVGELLLQKLEMRLDNVIYRSGFADSRRQARQMVGHGLFEINGHRVNIPSYELKSGVEVKIKEGKLKRDSVADKVKRTQKKEQTAEWLHFDHKQGIIKVINVPGRKEIGEQSNIQMVVEYYSR